MKVEEATAAVTPNILGSSGDTSGLEATIFDLDGALLGRIMDFIPLWNNGGQTIMALAKTCRHFRELFTWKVALEHCFLPYEGCVVNPRYTGPHLRYLSDSIWDYPSVKKYIWGYARGNGHAYSSPWEFDKTKCRMSADFHPLHKRWSNQKDLYGLDKLPRMLFWLLYEERDLKDGLAILKERKLHQAIYCFLLLHSLQREDSTFVRRFLLTDQSLFQQRQFREYIFENKFFQNFLRYSLVKSEFKDVSYNLIRMFVTTENFCLKTICFIFQENNQPPYPGPLYGLPVDILEGLSTRSLLAFLREMEAPRHHLSWKCLAALLIPAMKRMFQNGLLPEMSYKDFLMYVLGRVPSTVTFSLALTSYKLFCLQECQIHG
jgi:hypothetical protein